MDNKSSYGKFVAAFIAIITITAGGYFIWSNFFKYDINKVYKEQEAKYIAAMTADTYGGKTPQETLDLFVAALRSGDVELASKYFLLDEYSSREEWVKYLSAVKEKGLLTKMADDISTKAVAGNISSDTEFGYVLFNKDGTVGIQIDMRLNKYSGLWKIESF